MNAKQVQNLLIDAQATVDEKFLLLPRSQRSAAAGEIVNKINDLRDSLALAAHIKFEAAIAAGDVPAAREWQKIYGLALTTRTKKVNEMSVEDAFFALERAVYALSAM